jgi:hypothetical protein
MGHRNVGGDQHGFQRHGAAHALHRRAKTHREAGNVALRVRNQPASKYSPR